MSNLHPIFEDIFKTMIEPKKQEETEVPCTSVIMDYFNKAAGGAVVNCLTLEVFADMVSRKIGQQKASKMLSEAITQTIVMTGNQEKQQAKKDN